jgi:hypothetical protein
LSNIALRNFSGYGVYQELRLSVRESGALCDAPASPLYSYRMQTNSYSAPTKSLVACALVLVCVVSIGVPFRDATVLAKAQETLRPPFSLSIVPGIGGITMAKNKPHEFYVVITNVSGGAQSIWQYWNSWGYQAISFELTTADGRNFVLSNKRRGFTRNFPSTFIVEPGEHQIYPVTLDGWWESHPALPKTDEMPITLKAVYEVSTTPEASQYNVWTGRLESHRYNFSLRQW